ncbi:MAG: hypothetical protein LC640_10550 [Frankia sp.]|nr:hypothetical protein [Frankia sp.]
MKRFVESERGLRFKRDVEVKYLDNDAYLRRMDDDESEDGPPDGPDGEAATMIALGFIPPDGDLASIMDKVDDTSLGFYDARANALIVRGTTLTPAGRVVAVHELTHALQDQWFNLDRPELDDRNDEAATAFTALVEGDATRIEDAYYGTLSTAAQQDADDTLDGEVDIPLAIEVLNGFPYFAGADFATALADAGGNAAVDRAFRDPPTTSEHVLHPKAYRRREPATATSAPRADGTVVDSGVLGEVGLAALLAREGNQKITMRAASGWGGDHYVTWVAGKRVCTRVHLVMDTPNDRAEVHQALVTWAKTRTSTTIGTTKTGPLVITACEETP